ncbi:hypothetical protein Pd630_LPD09161 (plasmid) [Rhodococcus opacus PD630]|nr:hypothetical protein Pd630_LPD09161 [Rhodococcus opacus PD630]
MSRTLSGVSFREGACRIVLDTIGRMTGESTASSAGPGRGVAAGV